jgi:hypothetical protein
MHTRRAKLHLKLHKKLFSLSRLNNDGTLGSRYEWQIRKYSIVPRGLFYLLSGYVRKALIDSEHKNFKARKKKVFAALCRAADQCGCVPQAGIAGGDIAWLLDDEVLIAFQIHRDPYNRLRSRHLLKSAAAFRWVIEIRLGGRFKFVPLKSNVKYSAKDAGRI